MQCTPRPEHPTCLGLDLAWGEGNPSGAVALRDRGNGRLEPVQPATLLAGDASILQWLDDVAPHGPAVLAIDAPLIAPNDRGTCRPCDREVTRQFGRYHAGAYPANRVVAARAIALAEKLARRGWTLDPAVASARRAIEVYPHAATIGLFGLQRIVKYKKGRAAERCTGLATLLQLLRERLPRLQPPLAAPDPIDVARLVGRARKAVEDQLDAWICAAMAAVFHACPDDCEVIGDAVTGYIVVPRLPATASRS